MYLSALTCLCVAHDIPRVSARLRVTFHSQREKTKHTATFMSKTRANTQLSRFGSSDKLVGRVTEAHRQQACSSLERREKKRHDGEQSRDMKSCTTYDISLAGTPRTCKHPLTIQFNHDISILFPSVDKETQGMEQKCVSYDAVISLLNRKNQSTIACDYTYLHRTRQNFSAFMSHGFSLDNRETYVSTPLENRAGEERLD